MVVLCLVFAPRRVWIPLFGLLLCSGSIRTYAPINLNRGSSGGAASDEIRVMTYNTRGFGLTDSGRAEMTNYMIASGAQIIAFQEGMGSLEQKQRIGGPTERNGHHALQVLQRGERMPRTHFEVSRHGCATHLSIGRQYSGRLLVEGAQRAPLDCGQLSFAFQRLDV